MKNVWIVQEQGDNSIVDVLASAKKALAYALEDYLDGFATETACGAYGDYTINYQKTRLDKSVESGQLHITKYAVT